MKKLIGKRVEVTYVINGHAVDYEGMVQRVEGNLVFLIDVRADRDGGRISCDDQVVNTASSAFVCFDIIK
jgi:hypothetical protein